MRKIGTFILACLVCLPAVAQQPQGEKQQQRGNTEVRIGIDRQQAGNQQHKDQHNLSWALVAAINSCQSQLAESSLQQGAGRASDAQTYEQQFASTDKLFEQYKQGQSGDRPLPTACVAYYDGLKQFTQQGGKKEQIPSFTALNNAVVQAITAHELWGDPQFQQTASTMLQQSWSQVQKYSDTEDESIKKMQKDATTLVASIQQMHNIGENNKPQ